MQTVAYLHIQQKLSNMNIHFEPRMSAPDECQSSYSFSF